MLKCVYKESKYMGSIGISNEDKFVNDIVRDLTKSLPVSGDITPRDLMSNGDVQAMVEAFTLQYGGDDDKILQKIQDKLEKSLTSSTTVQGFQSGDTPKVFDNNKSYHLIQMTKNETSDAGDMPGSDIKAVLKGYKFNGLFWESPKSKKIFTVTLNKG